MGKRRRTKYYVTAEGFFNVRRVVRIKYRKSDARKVVEKIKANKPGFKYWGNPRIVTCRRR